VQNEKRQLETNLVVEQRIQNRETDKESIASQSDDEQDEDDVGSAVSNEDGSEDVFFECNTDLSRLSSKPLLPDETSTSGTSGTGQYSQGTTADHESSLFCVREGYRPAFCFQYSQGTTADHENFLGFVRERYRPTICCKISDFCGILLLSLPKSSSPNAV